MTLPLVQRARSDWLVCAILGCLASGFIWIIVPPLQSWVWAAILIIICPVLVRYTVSTYSAIRERRDGTVVLQLRNPRASIKSEIPCEYITRVETCEFFLPGTSRKPEHYPKNDYHHIHNQVGYKGPGLIVSYRLPARLGGANIERVWQFPAPQAEKFKTLLTDFSGCDASRQTAQSDPALPTTDPAPEQNRS